MDQHPHPLNFHNVKVEKANAKVKYRRMKKITALFRLLELCVFFFMVSRFTAQLPVAFRLSGEYFRGLSMSVVSPRFVFILGNAIVIVLFLKSGKAPAKDASPSGDNNGKFDLYEEYLKNCEKNRAVYKELECNKNVKKQRKQSTSVIREVVHPEPAHIDSQEETQKRKIKLHRSQSDNPKTAAPDEEDVAGKKLRRSLTVRYRESVNSEGKPAAAGTEYPEDQMSNEEFRRTVEAFIARQQRSLREED